MKGLIVIGLCAQPSDSGQFSSVVEQRFCKPSVVGSSPTTGSNFDRIVEGQCRDSGRMALNWRFICFLSMRMENSPSVSLVGIATTLLFSTTRREWHSHVW